MTEINESKELAEAETLSKSDLSDLLCDLQNNLTRLVMHKNLAYREVALFAIIVGYDDEFYNDLMNSDGWFTGNINDLKRLRKTYVSIFNT